MNNFINHTTYCCICKKNIINIQEIVKFCQCRVPNEIDGITNVAHIKCSIDNIAYYNKFLTTKIYCPICRRSNVLKFVPESFNFFDKIILYRGWIIRLIISILNLTSSIIVYNNYDNIGAPIFLLILSMILNSVFVLDIINIKKMNNNNHEENVEISIDLTKKSGQTIVLYETIYKTGTNIPGNNYPDNLYTKYILIFSILVFQFILMAINFPIAIWYSYKNNHNKNSLALSIIGFIGIYIWFISPLLFQITYYCFVWPIEKIKEKIEKIDNKFYRQITFDHDIVENKNHTFC